MQGMRAFKLDDFFVFFEQIEAQGTFERVGGANFEKTSLK
jgi:hypothetical protein